MVVVSNGWLDHAADNDQTLLRPKGLRMSTQVTSMNSTTIATTTTTPPTTPLKSDWKHQQQPQNQQPPSPTPTLSTTINGPARAALLCQPNSHPFQTRNILLEPNQEIKVGRSITRNRITDNNAVFECKVLSRNHAVLWYSDGKFFVKDTASSNGTFVNNQRLSQTNAVSEPFEVRSGDVVQFGVDVLENSRKETHGCIVALLKLYLPDGDETKSSIVASNSILTADLYHLNQYVQEGAQREQMLDSKLMSIQKIVDTTRKSCTTNWQAMVDEDRLLSRIDILENKLQCFQKNMTDDKLREEVLKLQEDKSVYQNSAKEALRKVYQERIDAVQKLSTIERALCSSEDECSLLRDQMLKIQQNFQELTVRFNSTETKCAELKQQLLRAHQREKQLEQEEQNLYTQIKKLTLECLQTKDILTNITKEKDDLMERLICYEQFDTIVSDEETEDVLITHMAIPWLQNSSLKNEKESNAIINAICQTSNTNTNEDVKNVELNELKINDKLIEIEKNIFILENQCSLNNGSQISTDENSTEPSAISDGNQNNQHCTDDNSTSSQDLLKNVIVLLKDVYSELRKKQLFIKKTLPPEDTLTDKLDACAKLTSIELELQTIKLELETRPTYNQYQEKITQIENLQQKMVSLTLEKSQLETQLEQVELELELNDKKRTVEYCDAQQQTHNNENEQSTISPIVSIIEQSLTQTHDDVVNDKIQLIIENDLEMITDPDIQREEELIAFKEQCAKLTEDNILLKNQMNELQIKLSQSNPMNSWTMYAAPLLVVLMGYLLISPYL